MASHVLNSPERMPLGLADGPHYRCSVMTGFALAWRQIFFFCSPLLVERSATYANMSIMTSFPHCYMHSSFYVNLNSLMT
jgi:hypothetical protein